MGSSKQTQTSDSNQTSRSTASPLESQFNDILGKSLNDLIPQAGNTSSSFLDLLRQGANAFGGGEAAKGPLGQLLGGISPEVQNSIVQESLRQIMPQFGQGGILNSGAAASIASRTAGDIYRNSAQFNVSNLGNVLQALLTGNAQTQQGINQQSQILSGNLQGLRTTNTYGNNTQTLLGQNPFVNSLETSAGKTIGGGINPTNLASGGFGGFAQGLNTQFGGGIPGFAGPSIGNAFSTGSDVSRANPFAKNPFQSLYGSQ